MAMESSLTMTAVCAEAGERIPGTNTNPPEQISWADAQTTRDGTTYGRVKITYKLKSVITFVKTMNQVIQL